MTTPMTEHPPVNRPLGERINLRMLTVAIILSLLVGMPIYGFVKNQLNHGIKKTTGRFNVDLKALGNFPFNEYTGTLDNIPAQYRQLDGQRVALEGMMYSPLGADRVNDFQFVYNIQKCCLGGPPQVQERVFAVVPHNGTIDFHNEEIRIIGILHVQTNKDEVGKVEKVYTLDVERAEPL